MAQKLPNFDQMSSNYPTGTADEVKTAVGGNVNAGWITNTCVVRVSKALNYGGDPVVYMPGVLTVSGSDKKRYALRVKEFRVYMTTRYGKASVVVKKGANGLIDKTNLAGKRGIICFEVKGWSDATGHFSLWNGSSVLYDGGHDYFGGLAYEAALWAAT
jgi:hypothetical protein